MAPAQGWLEAAAAGVGQGSVLRVRRSLPEALPHMYGSIFGSLAAVQDPTSPHTGSSTGVLTLSAGISGTITGRAVPLEQLIQAADKALYRAKTAGRNRIALAP